VERRGPARLLDRIRPFARFRPFARAGTVAGTMSNRLALPLFIVGYPVSVAAIARWKPLMRDRKTGLFLAHQAAVAAIVAGWAVKHEIGPVLVNGAWLVTAAVWWVVAGRLAAGAAARPAGSKHPTCPKATPTAPPTG
jgi:hypothetical protein